MPHLRTAIPSYPPTSPRYYNMCLATLQKPLSHHHQRSHTKPQPPFVTYGKRDTTGQARPYSPERHPARRIAGGRTDAASHSPPVIRWRRSTRSVLCVCLIEIRQAPVCGRVRYPRTGDLGVAWYPGGSLTETGINTGGDISRLVGHGLAMMSGYPKRPKLTAAQGQNS
jgi:hypothetical protein